MILLGLMCILFVVCDAKQPNILLIVADDQDLVLNGMSPMRHVQEFLGVEGATFTNAFSSSPLCCPSRATILTGMYAHNHGTKNNSEAGGCYNSHWRLNVEPRALPAILQSHGYNTFFAGKYLNEYCGAKVPKGWNYFYGLHGNSKYYNYTLTENGKLVHYPNEYFTDLLEEKIIKFLENRKITDKPFFALIAPPAPHDPFTPAPRHVGAYDGLKALKTPNFNVESGILDKHWLIQHSRKIPEGVLNTMDTYFQKRWESLLSVDEMVGEIISRLDLTGELDNTYVVYTSDNGYHIGQFAQPYDKRQPYETDIHVPFLVRGPDVPRNVVVEAPISLVDLYPTFLEWAGVSSLGNEDGQSFNAFLMNSIGYNPLRDSNYSRSLLIQHWGEGNFKTYYPECPYTIEDNMAECSILSDCHCQDTKNNTYSCVRHFNKNTNRLYCEFKDEENFVEAYDVNEDPYQIKNLGYKLLPIERALYSIALSKLTSCSGSACRNINI